MSQDASTVPDSTSAQQVSIGVAIPIPEPHAGELQRWRKEFGDPLAGAIPSHVTLLPPTRVARTALESIEEHLRAAAAAFAPFQIHLRGSATFAPVSPVVFVPLIRGVAECGLLERRIRSGPLEQELRFHYHPHVTVAHHVGAEALQRALAELASYEAAFSVWGFSLYQHGPDGVWRPRRDYVLAQPAN